jgi:hypothetical protein
MSSLQIEKSGKPTKFMPTILLCPIYAIEDMIENKHLEDIKKELKIDLINEPICTSEHKNVAKCDMHYRFHKFDVRCKGIIIFENYLIDFKHFFSVPASYLLENRKNRKYRLNDIHAEQITLKFASYLSRVAIPVIVPNTENMCVESDK